MTVWKKSNNAPTHTLVQGYFGELDEGAPVTGPNIWTCWQNDLGEWYGDHHSSWTGTSKPEPNYWCHLPAAPSTLKAPQLKAGRLRGESRGQLTGRAKLAARNYVNRFASASRRAVEQDEIAKWLAAREAPKIDDLTDEQKHEFIKWLKVRKPA